MNNNKIFANEMSEEWFSNNLSENQKLIRDFLRNFNLGELYISAIFALKNSLYPARQTIVAHCFREILNGVSREQKEDTQTEAEKFEETFKQANTNASANEISERAKRAKNAKEAIFSPVHYGNDGVTMVDENIFAKNIELLEDYILQLRLNYFERKTKLDRLIPEINTEPWQKPTQTQIDVVMQNTSGNLIREFLYALKNPEWFDSLKDTFMFKHEIIEYPKGHKEVQWDAISYFTNIANDIPQDIIKVYQSEIKEMAKSQADCKWLWRKLLDLALILPDEQFKIILKDYDEKYIQQIESMESLDQSKFKSILERLAQLDKNAALCLCMHILAITPIKEYSTITLKPKQHSRYNYKQALNIVIAQFMGLKLELLQLLRYIFTDMCREVKVDWNIKFRRPAIEEHEQNTALFGGDEPENLLISAIRDTAQEIISNSKEEAKNVFELLESAKNIHITRIILHLLRMNDYNELLSQYISNDDVFSNVFYTRYEYYHLLEDKFCQLSPEEQMNFFKWVDDKIEYDEDGYCLILLYPIKTHLTKEQSKQYHSTLFDKDDNERHMDDMGATGWVGYVSNKSPISEEELARLTIPELIEYLNNWNAEDKTDFRQPINKQGLANILKQIVKAEPAQYLDSLLKFKQINDMQYIQSIFFALQEGKCTPTDEQVENIVTFTGWLADKEERQGLYCAKMYAMETAFNMVTAGNKESSEEIINAFIDILKKVVRQKEANLDAPLNDCHTNARNSINGRAVEYLIRCYKPNSQSSNAIEDTLKELIQNPPYPETYSIFGEHLSYLYYIMPDFIKDNLDLLLPENENERSKFDATFTSYIQYGQHSWDNFQLLEDKYKFALRNKLYANMSTEAGKLGEWMAVYYNKGLFNTDSEFLTLMFDIPENKQVQMSFTFQLKRYSENEENNRYDDFMHWFINHISGRELEYHELLEDNWRENKLSPYVPKYTRKIFEIVRNLSIVHKIVHPIVHPREYFNIVKLLAQYIYENNFPDDSTLKADKDDFIKKYISKRGDSSVYNELTQYLEVD